MAKANGKIDVSKLNTPPLEHEFKTVKLLASKGFDVEFLKPNQHKGSKTPDIRMANLLWEIKCPKGKGKYTLAHAFKAAAKQSSNIIVDLRGYNFDQENAINKLIKEFDVSKRVKRMKIIRKPQKILDFIK